MSKPIQGNWFYSILALLFSLLLFFNANSQGNNSTTTNTGSQTYDEMLYNIPVQLEYDSDKYFVSGYEETVNVQLTSANRIQLNVEANEDTRNFQVVADLTQTPLGTSEVQLRVKGLSTAVNAEIEPKTITITVEKKVTKSFAVEAQLPEGLESEGYNIDDITISPKSVDITTGEETAKAISKVIAPLAEVNQAVASIKQTVNVQAVDGKNQVLSVVNPTPQVKVEVKLGAPSKEVPISVVTTGAHPPGVSYYTFTLSDATVEITGAQSVLDTITSVELPVDVSSIREKTKQTVAVPNNDGYKVIPSEIEITLTPVFETSTSTSNNGTGTYTTSEAYIGTTRSSGANEEGSTTTTVNQTETTNTASTVEDTGSNN